MDEKYVKLSDVEDVLKKAYLVTADTYNEVGWSVGYNVDDVDDGISKIPTADVAPVVHAHWERYFDTEDGRYYKCTVCGRTIFIDKDYVWRDPEENHPYCHCGAKMDEKENEK